MSQQQAVRLEGRLEDKYAAVEAVRPSGIRGCGKLRPVKQLIDIGQHLAKKAMLSYLMKAGDTCHGHLKMARRRLATGNVSPLFFDRLFL